MQLEQKTLEERNHELAEAFRVKSKALHQTQKMYQQLKVQQLNEQVATAAADDAEQTVRTARGNGRFEDRMDTGMRTASQRTSQFPVDIYGGESLHQRQHSGGSAEGAGYRLSQGWGKQVHRSQGAGQYPSLSAYCAL